MSGRVSLLTPSRGRPVGLLRMAHSALETADDPGRVELCLRVDEDDPHADAYEAVALGLPSCRMVLAPRGPMSGLWDEAMAASTGAALMLCADDLRFLSQGWDSAVLAALRAEPYALAYGRDGVHDEGLATHPFVSRGWVDLLGRFVPPYFSCDYADAWLDSIAREAGLRRYLPGVEIRHDHPLAGRAPTDRTYEETRARGARDNPGARFAGTAGERSADAEALRRAAAEDRVP